LHVFRLDKLLDLVVSTYNMHMNDNIEHLFCTKSNLEDNLLLSYLHNFCIVPADTETNSKNKDEIDGLIASMHNLTDEATAVLHMSDSKKEETRFQVIIFLHAVSIKY
jgi:hypothetical protein